MLDMVCWELHTSESHLHQLLFGTLAFVGQWVPMCNCKEQRCMLSKPWLTHLWRCTHTYSNQVKHKCYLQRLFHNQQYLGNSNYGKSMELNFTQSFSRITEGRSILSEVRYVFSRGSKHHLLRSKFWYWALGKHETSRVLALSKISTFGKGCSYHMMQGCYRKCNHDCLARIQQLSTASN